MNIGLIRCEKNEKKCPLTSCIKSHDSTVEGFAGYEDCSLTGVLTCRCPGDDFADMVKILKAKGAEAVHIVTCTFARKEGRSWEIGDGFCERIEELSCNAAEECRVPVVMGTAHLPVGYILKSFCPVKEKYK